MVIGLGNFGYNAAYALAKAGKEVIAIDSNSGRVEEIGDKVRKAATVDVRNKKAISELISLNNIDVAIVSLGDNLEASILAIMYLKEMKIERIIAKASNEDQSNVFHALGVDEVIFPEQEVAQKLALRLVKPNFIDYLPMAEDYGIIEYEVPAEFVGKTLAELNLRNKYNIEIIAVKNIMSGNLSMLPRADYTFEPDMVIIMIGRNEDIEKFKYR